ncbi:MAG: hypothetical protein PVG32_15940 [Anaerolineales bacterium]
MRKISITDGLDIVNETEAHWMRNNGLLWSEVEPVEGERNWNSVAGLEQELQKASDSGYQVILIIRSTPSWAQRESGIPCGPIKPDKLSAFVNFVGDAVTRYSTHPFNVKYWEIWNEPDGGFNAVRPMAPFGCWGDQNEPFYGGRYYGEMLKLIYPRIKLSDPDAKVLVGGLLLDCDPIHPPETPKGSGKTKDCSPSTFLEGVLQNGGGDFFDGVSFHAYDYYHLAQGAYANPNWHSAWDTTGPTLIAKARYLRSLLEEYGYIDKFLVNTEMALLCTSKNQEDCQTEVFNRTKANYLAQSYAAAVAEGLRGNVWYSLTGWRHSGLVDKNLNPFPAYQAYKVSLEALDKAAYWGEITDYPNTKGYDFLREGAHLWIIWSLDGNTHNIQLPNIPESILDLFGNPIPATEEIEIGLDPIYIHWDAESP